ncbi:hypothetical protein CEN47_28030 [Fischerella thermalis CCMEE 5319]|nr:hypothetical protein CEN47_28030 [Fischerella thermalis CCMEE 5319]
MIISRIFCRITAENKVLGGKSGIYTTLSVGYTRLQTESELKSICINFLSLMNLIAIFPGKINTYDSS